MKCDNCSNQAAYTHADAGVNPAHYCVKCLPHWLHDRANAGHFPLMTPIAETVGDVIEDPIQEDNKVAKKKSSVKSTAVPTPEAPTSESN